MFYGAACDFLKYKSDETSFQHSLPSQVRITPSYRIECDFLAGMPESNVTLLYFGLVSAAEDIGADIISQSISNTERLKFRASFEIIASDEQLERVSYNFQNHMGVISTYVSNEQISCYSLDLLRHTYYSKFFDESITDIFEEEESRFRWKEIRQLIPKIE